MVAVRRRRWEGERRSLLPLKCKKWWSGGRHVQIKRQNKSKEDIYPNLFLRPMLSLNALNWCLLGVYAPGCSALNTCLSLLSRQGRALEELQIAGPWLCFDFKEKSIQDFFIHVRDLSQDSGTITCCQIAAAFQRCVSQSWVRNFRGGRLFMKWDNIMIQLQVISDW